MPAEGFVDAHHHIWRYADMGWMHGPMVPRIFGEYEGMKRDYPIEQFLKDIAGSGVTTSVYVQTNWVPVREVDEVAWVQSVADASGWPHAIVGYADLNSPNLAAVLDAQCEHRLLRGIRQQVHWHVNPQYRYANRPDLVADPTWRKGFAQLAPRKLLFEIQVFAGQMKLAADLARAFPETTLVLEHAGMLEDTSSSGWAAWRAGMRELAACPNMNVKLSGLGTFVHRATVEEMAPIIQATVEIFGPDRCMWGSNFPVENLWTDYGTVIGAVRKAIEIYSPSDQRKLMGDTARRLYRID